MRLFPKKCAYSQKICLLKKCIYPQNNGFLSKNLLNRKIIKNEEFLEETIKYDLYIKEKQR